MSNNQNESLLVSGLQNIEYQVQEAVNSQIYKLRQLSNYEQEIQNQSLIEDEIDPRIKQKYLNLRSKIQFENEEDELEFLEIIIYWNQCLQQNVRLNQQVTEYINQLVQNQLQNEFPVSKIHMIDYEENQGKSSFSIFNSNDQRFEKQKQKDTHTQTQNPNFKFDKSQQTDLKDIDQEDTQNMVEFFNSSFYRDLKNKQFLIDAQLISLIQTVFLMHNQRKIDINQPILQEVNNLMSRIKKKDQISYNTITIIRESLEM